MWYALIHDVAASWERYEAVAASLRCRPRGLVVHLAGPTDEGFRIIEIWESESAWRAFAAAFEAGVAAVDPEVESRAIVRELHAHHIDRGDTWPKEVVSD